MDRAAEGFKGVRCEEEVLSPLPVTIYLLKLHSKSYLNILLNKLKLHI